MAALRRVLVANRGEIARRVIRGAHDAGAEAVAVYAQDDAASPHVGEADAAVLLPGTALRETYLNPAALDGGGRGLGLRRLHPGYGFLSENPTLPEACAAAGIVWVGPPIEAMRVMGHKARAKEVVAAAGVPVLPSALVEPDCLERRACRRRRPPWGSRSSSRPRPVGAGGACAWSSGSRIWPRRWLRPSGRPPRPSGRTRSSWSATWPRRATSRCR